MMTKATIHQHQHARPVTNEVYHLRCDECEGTEFICAASYAESLGRALTARIYGVVTVTEEMVALSFGEVRGWRIVGQGTTARHTCPACVEKGNGDGQR